MNPEKDWLHTVSGRIYTELEDIASKNKLSLHVERKGELYEYFHVDNRIAKLSKRLEGGTVGETGGTLRTYVELWDYQHFLWWKEAIDKAKVDVGFLEMPIDKLAEEANVSQFGQRFALPDDESHPIAQKERVKDHMKQALNPLLAPDMELKFYEGSLRLHPKNEKAKDSLRTFGKSYQNALAAIRKATS